jgi:metal-sulfur cluster biosynthetic enzyme
VDKDGGTGDKCITCNKFLTKPGTTGNSPSCAGSREWKRTDGSIQLAEQGYLSKEVIIAVVTEERVKDQLRNVIDPEIGMDLVELGLIYDVGVHDEGRHVDVTFSLTSPMCPVGDLIQEQVEAETLSIEGVDTVNAQLTFEPMWNPDMMSPAAKLFFGR